MSKIIITHVLLLLLGISAQAQLISKWTWDTGSPSTADYGPNGTSISTYATTSAGGVGGTKGLNAGPGRHDIDLVVPGAVFMVPGLDISVDFAKQENGASFFTIGGLDLGISGGALYVKYIVKVAGSDVSVSATNKYTFVDANFHTFRFIYNNFTGNATLYVDGASVYTASYAANTPLSWTGATNATIGSILDGGNSNVPNLDNLIIQAPSATLPLELLSFEVRRTADEDLLTWKTSGEKSLEGFVIQRSTDGVSYSDIGAVAAEGNNSAADNDYKYTATAPAGTMYYRLKMVNIDGKFSFSPVKKVGAASGRASSGSASSGTGAGISLTCYPNPVVSSLNIRFDRAAAANSNAYYYSVITSDGRTVSSGRITADTGNATASVSVSSAPRGILFLRLQQADMAASSQTFKIMKQ